MGGAISSVAGGNRFLSAFPSRKWEELCLASVWETAVCVGSVLFVLMLFAAHYKFCP